MSGFDQVAWFPLCAGLTALGLVFSWAVGRRRGAAAALRGVAWSLLPLAAYLTGVLPLVWDTATAVVGWAGRLVFSPRVWVGVGLAGIAFVLFTISNGLRGRAAARGRASRAAAPAAGARQVPPGARPAALASSRQGAPGQPARAQSGAKQPAARPAGPKQPAPVPDDDFSEAEEILRRRGIT